MIEDNFWNELKDSETEIKDIIASIYKNKSEICSFDKDGRSILHYLVIFLSDHCMLLYNHLINIFKNTSTNLNKLNEIKDNYNMTAMEYAYESCDEVLLIEVN